MLDTLVMGAHHNIVVGQLDQMVAVNCKGERILSIINKNLST